MKNSLRQSDRTSATASRHVVSDRSGFTMVELLIAVAILVILTTLTVSAFTVNDADRVSNSIGTFKNALEGARSRAINSGEVRGLRLITDPNDGRIAKSMVYIGSAGTLEGELQIGVYDATENSFFIEEQGSNNEWGPLGVHANGRSLIQSGSRIEIPTNSGKWYTILEPTDMTSDTTMKVAGIFTPGEWVSGNYREIPSGEDFTYRLELAPTVLEGAEPILLDPQTCIDLDGSVVPGDWRPATASVGYGENSSGTVVETMDILFAPDGTITGEARTFGVVRFRFAYLSDVILASTLGGRPLVQAATPPAAVVPADPEKIHKALAIFGQTGGIVISDIDPSISSGLTDGFNNDIADTPYSYALLGKESN